jgi:hypothetical protein
MHAAHGLLQQYSALPQSLVPHMGLPSGAVSLAHPLPVQPASGTGPASAPTFLAASAGGRHCFVVQSQ